MTGQTLAVLRVLLDDPTGDHYGLDIAREINLKTGTIYPLLARLEQHGWLTSGKEQIDPSKEGRPARRIYRLTGVGESRARQTLEEHRRMLEPQPRPRRWQPLPGGGTA